MNFYEALEKAKEGYKLRGSGWAEGAYMFFYAGTLMLRCDDDSKQEFTVLSSDLERDYTIVHEEKEDEIVEVELALNNGTGFLHFIYGDNCIVKGNGLLINPIRTGIKRKYNKTKKCFVVEE